MIRGLKTLLAVAAVAGTGTAFAADDDTMRLGRFQPTNTADAGKDDTKTLDGKDDDTELIHWRRYGYSRGFYHGYTAGFGGFGYARPFYAGFYGYSYYRPSYVSYYAAPAYYAPPVYFTPTYYVAPSYYYGGFCPIGGGADVPAVDLRLQVAPRSQQPPATIPPADVPQPMPPAGSYKYDGDPKSVPLPMPMTPGAQRPETDGVRVSLPSKSPSKFKYAAYGEKK